MTVMAACPQCGWSFPAHTDRPVTPAHTNPGTQLWCSGASQLALTGVS